MPNTYTQLLVHVVFATKHRSAAISEELEDELYRFVAGVLDRESCKALAVGGMPDHIHVLISMRPIHALAYLVKRIKGASSRWLNRSGQLDEHFAWQEGYGGFSVSPSQLDKVRRYILNQKEHHRSRSFAEEWEELLERHGVLEASLHPGPRPLPRGQGMRKAREEKRSQGMNSLATPPCPYGTARNLARCAQPSMTRSGLWSWWVDAEGQGMNSLATPPCPHGTARNLARCAQPSMTRSGLLSW